MNIVQNERTITIVSMGEATFARVWTRERTASTPRALAHIPHGMVVEVQCSGRVWVFETWVTLRGEVEYSCRWKGEDVSGEWQSSPSKAYVEINAKLEGLGMGNPRFNRKEDGTLLVGMTGPAVQDAIRKHFGLGRLLQPEEARPTTRARLDPSIEAESERSANDVAPNDDPDVFHALLFSAPFEIKSTWDF